MNSNKYNLPPFKLGIARYLASREFSSIYGLSNSTISPKPKSMNENLPEIPEEGEVKLTGEFRPRKPSGFVARPNFTFGEPDADAVSFRTNSTMDECQNVSESSVTTENMQTPGGPKKKNQCPRKASSSTVSTQGSNMKKRNRLGSIEDEIKNHIFMSPQAPKSAQKRHSQQLVDLRQEFEEKYTKILYQVGRKIPMCEDSYVYSVLLFREVLQKIEQTQESRQSNEKLTYEQKFLLARLKEQPELFSNIDLIYRTCVFLAYKVIEDEYTLFIRDFAGVVRVDWEDVEELEIFIVADVMDFRMISLETWEEDMADQKKELANLGH